MEEGKEEEKSQTRKMVQIKRTLRQEKEVLSLCLANQKTPDKNLTNGIRVVTIMAYQKPARSLVTNGKPTRRTADQSAASTWHFNQSEATLKLLTNHMDACVGIPVRFRNST